MSIINDALKKVQANLDQKKNSENTPPPDGPSPPPSPSPGPESHTYSPYYTPAPTSPPDFGKPYNVNEPLPPPVTTPMPSVIQPAQSCREESGQRSSRNPILTVLCVLGCLLVIVGSAYSLMGKKSLKIGKMKLSLPPIKFKLPSLSQGKISFPKVFHKSAPSSAARSTPAQPDQPGTIRIKGVMMMSDRNVALINNDIYEVGDFIDDMEITHISKENVQMNAGGEIKTFRVPK